MTHRFARKRGEIPPGAAVKLNTVKLLEGPTLHTSVSPANSPLLQRGTDLHRKVQDLDNSETGAYRKQETEARKAKQ